MNNEAIFPTSESTPFPKKFRKYVEIIFKRLFRVFAILYCTHLKAITENNAIAHLNTCFRHFMYFVYVFHLVEPRELKALPGLTGSIRKEYVPIPIPVISHYKYPNVPNMPIPVIPNIPISQICQFQSSIPNIPIPIPDIHPTQSHCHCCWPFNGLGLGILVLVLLLLCAALVSS